MYVDTYPSDPNSEQSYITFAHELQHLMNFATSNVKRTSVMDTWIDEGLATAAEYIYLEPYHATERIQFFNYDRGNYIRDGNNFFVWGNHETGNSYATLGDYSTAYLFFQWLRLQSSGGKGIYKDIITSRYADYRAVTAAARQGMSDADYTDDADGWGRLLRDWMAANYIKSTDSRYGYKADTSISSIAVKPHPGGTTSISLAPGEGVYSSVNSAPYTIPGASGDIKYAGLSASVLSASVSDSGSLSSGNKLLTYNANTNINGGAASGSVTGAASIIPGGFSASMSLSESRPSAPYAIDAQDVLRRHGHTGWGNASLRDLPLVETDAAD
jgi:hypothetical protein